jgi:phosphoribosylamine--glycine ligase
LPRLRSSDLLDLFEGIATGTLSERHCGTWTTRTAVTVVLASDGYPGKYEKGGCRSWASTSCAIAYVFHMGTAEGKEGTVCARMVVACFRSQLLARDAEQAIAKRISQMWALISFEGKTWPQRHRA